KLTEVSTQATRLQDKLVTQRAELAVVVDRLTQQRATVADDILAATVQCDLAAAQPAPGRVAELAEQLAAKAPETAAAELAEAVEAAATLRQRHGEVAHHLAEMSSQLRGF